MADNYTNQNFARLQNYDWQLANHGPASLNWARPHQLFTNRGRPRPHRARPHQPSTIHDLAPSNEEQEAINTTDKRWVLQR